MSKVRREEHKWITTYQTVTKELKREGALRKPTRQNRKLWRAKMEPIFKARKLENIKGV